MKNITLQLFLRFLKENNLLFKYKHLLNEKHTLSQYESFLMYYKNNTYDNFADFLVETLFKDLFNNFLLMKGIKNKFFDNIFTYCNLTFTTFFKTKTPYEYVFPAFKWDFKKEDYAFWYKINDEWRQFYCKIISIE